MQNKGLYYGLSPTLVLQPVHNWSLSFTQASTTPTGPISKPSGLQPQSGPNWLQSSSVASFFPVLGLDFKTLPAAHRGAHPCTATVHGTSTAMTTWMTHYDDDLSYPHPLSTTTVMSTYSLQKHANDNNVHTHLHNQWRTGHNCRHIPKPQQTCHELIAAIDRTEICLVCILSNWITQNGHPLVLSSLAVSTHSGQLFNLGYLSLLCAVGKDEPGTLWRYA